MWFYRHRPDLKPEVSEAQQHIFDTGHEIGGLAQGYFPSGVEITEEYYEIDKAIKSTETAVGKGERFIFEATACSPDGAFSRIDILKKVNGSDAWDLIEVKASTEVKDYHIHDITFQRYAFANAGYKIRNSILMHVNNQYVRSGELNVNELFNLEDCTGFVMDVLPGIKGELRNLIQIVNKNQEPSVDIGDHPRVALDAGRAHHPRTEQPDRTDDEQEVEEDVHAAREDEPVEDVVTQWVVASGGGGVSTESGGSASTRVETTSGSDGSHRFGPHVDLRQGQ